MFSDVKQPKTVAGKENGQFISASYELITEKEVLSACVEIGKVVIKRVLMQMGEKVYILGKRQFYEIVGSLENILKKILTLLYRNV